MLIAAVLRMNFQTSSIEIMRQTVDSYRKMIDGTVSQLSDHEFFQRPSPEINSVANVLRHLGGNLLSRWTDFLATDGEKQSRNRDLEFADWSGSRAELMDYFESGWNALTLAVSEVNESNISSKIFIRGEEHTVFQALIRSVTHLSYHTGQITLIARIVHEGDWNWLTIAPNKSNEFNSETWGTSKSRAVLAVEKEAK